MQYREEIDGLRALAIAPVVLFHAGVAGFGGGFIGVDIFYVISGYLITAIIVEDIAAGEFRAANFYERRARRIVPALVPVLIAATMAAWWLFTPDDFRRFAQSLAATALFASNFLFAQKADYFYGGEGFQPLLHGWSLAVEEQFYIAFPLFLVVCASFRRTALLPAVLVLFTASFAAAALLAPVAPKLSFYMLPTRMWELMAGAACALLPRLPRPRQLPAMAGLVLIAAGFLAIDGTTPAPGPMFALPVIGTLLLLLFAGKETLAGRALSWRPLVGLGLVSYGTYLWHQPILAFMHYVWFGPIPIPATVGAIVASVLLGSLSLWLIERPIRQERILAGRRALAAACLASLGIAAILGVAGHFHKLEPRSAAQADRLSAAFAGRDVDPVIVPLGGALPFVLYGDSHARQYYPALAERFGRGALISESACLSLDGLSNYPAGDPAAAQCHAQLGHLLGLVRSRKVRTVILAQRWNKPAWDTHANKPLGTVSEGGGPTLAAALRRTMAMLPSDVNLVIVGDVPTAWAAGEGLSWGYLRCKAFLNTHCPASYPAHQADGRSINPLLVAFADSHPRVEYVDAAARLCPDDRCRILHGGTLYYSDGSHLTVHAARLVVAQFGNGMVR